MEGSCSRTSDLSRPDVEFTDLLFSCSPTEIFDEDLYKYQVEKIPEVFESVDHYLSSYVYPLLEETRAALASSLETVYKAPFAEVVSIREEKLATRIYNVKVDNWRNKVSGRGKEPYRTLSGDLVLLSGSKPENVSDLQRTGWKYTLASVVRISDDENGDNSTSSCFKLKTADVVEVGDQQSKSLYVVYLTNITTHERTWNALRMRRNLKIIEKVLVKNDLGQGNCEFCPQNIPSEAEEKFRSTLLSKLNESQHRAVVASISKIGCHHRSSVELIWGPPGTGKTLTLSTLLYILLEMNVRTLICAPTNTAITRLASCVTKLVRNSVKSESRKSSRICHLGGLLLFGDNDHLKVDWDVQEIFLDYRIDKLKDILVPRTAWRHCVFSMLDFLEHCVSLHRMFVENEQIKSKKHYDAKTTQSGTKSFLDFARDQFKKLASPLRNCMLTVVTHLPRSFIDEENHQSIVQLFSLVESLEKLLFEDNGLTSKDLETIFMQQIMTGSELFIDATSLHCIRSQCVFILRSLQASLSKLGLPTVVGKSATAEFCFQKASLIFCTISSAFKLHSVDIEPFQLLVIDEAAHVNECETIIAFQTKNVRHAILVGDVCQLPAAVSSKMSKEAGFGRSLFERLSSMGHPKHLLNVQYRMHPSISLFPNSKFYQNQILDGPNVQNKSYEKSYLREKMFGPYSFINVSGGREESDDAGVSTRNMVEVAVIVKLVQKLLKARGSSREKLSIGVMSQYAAQVAAIQDKLQSRYYNLTVKVKSIDGFQGGEEDIIIISTVSSHKHGSIGFSCSHERTNVALTRARHCLWILGNEGTLSESDSVWKAIISDAKDRQCFFNADEDPEIEKTIIDVKKELDQLDDFLSGESTLFKNLRWQILFSDNFRKSFHKLRFSSTKKVVINLLLKLARGWRPSKVSVDWKCENSSYIIKQFKVDIYYVVCSIDMLRDSIYKQVLKVWDILPMTDTTKLLRRIDGIASMYTNDFINHCNEKLLESNLEVPLSWSLSSDILRFKSPSNTKLDSCASTSSIECTPSVENSKVSESLLLMKFYPLSSGTVNHLLWDVEGTSVDFPFEVTDEEREIIHFTGSSFILGRSGTGKTTILTMKLYRTFQQYCIASRYSDDIVSISDEVDVDGSVSITNEVDSKQCHDESKGRVLHQLFVTVSPILCHAVKYNVAQMKRIAAEKFSGENNFAGMDDVDEVSEFQDIPDTFSGIQQEKYPLIITFHKFLMMLDGTLGKSFFQRFPYVRDSSHFEGRRSVALQTFLRKKEVTYDRFSSKYWPHFNAKLTKSLDAPRVFTEIMSHIKGSPLEGEACDYKRSRHDYISLSESRRSTLCVEQRCAIYDIFEDYEKMKSELLEFDLADFVNDIHLRLDKEDFPGDKMDYVYIDEVQDLTMRQISLFKYICNNVDRGFTFSGDTAQTISKGIDFRFEDIRSLFYNEFLMRSKSCDISGKREKGLISDMFYLSHNYRTHTGVLRLAQSVVDLICYYFPHSIDVLTPETSCVYGGSPVFLESVSDENLITSIFGCNGKSSGKRVGFGADQVILVRDDSAKKEISNYIGHQAALILTIVECKGLEFQDVLLYNFFGSSPLSKQWRLVYEFLNEKGLFDGDSAKSFPTFSQSKHNLLCSELKQLYVAITRTRQRLWICENNVDVSKPMLDYWGRLSLVQVVKIDDSLAETMHKASTPEEWKSQGIKLFWEKNYEMAKMCFEKAGDETWKKRATVSALRAAADSQSNSELLFLEEELGNFDEASEIAKSLGDTLREIDLLEKAGQFSNACSLLFSYIISNILWGSGNRGWPLKSFPQKVELLNRLMSIARKVSVPFHASVCAQAKFLLYDQRNLSELKQIYNASKRYKTPICEILAVRKLLEVHCEVNATKYEWDDDLLLNPRTFDQRISMNQASNGTLFYLWNLWKAHILEALECLNSLEKTDSVKLEGGIRFCFDYFGLRLQDNSNSSVTFHLLTPDAAWIKNVAGFVRRNRNVATLEARHFVPAARSFWLQELVSVGLSVLDVFQKLYRSSTAKSLSVRYYQSMCLLHIFDIAKFLLDLKSIDIKYTDNKKLQDFVHLCVVYHSFIFTLDPRASLFEEMISLRETELSRNLLEECVFRKIRAAGELGFDEVSLAVITMLGTGKMKHGFYDRIGERISNNSPWRSCFENLRETAKSDSVKESPLICFAEGLYKGIIGTWVTRAPILPPAFLYLVERLLILAPHRQAFFFTTKSSFVEYLVSLPPDANPGIGLGTDLSSSTLMVVFVRIVVEQILDGIFDTEGWFKIYKINYNSYNPVFMLRLLMIMCLLCMSWDLRFDVINQKLDIGRIKSQLPREFYKALRYRRPGYDSFISAVATAFKIIGDPLVIVVSGDTDSTFPYPDAVFLDLRSMSCKTDIMKTLFPWSTEASRDQPSNIVMPPLFSNEGNNTIIGSSEMTSNSSSKNGNGNLKINWDLIGDLLKAFERRLNRNDVDFGLLLRNQVEVRKHLELITSAITGLSEQRSHCGDDKDFPDDCSHLIEDLNTLLSLLHTSEYDSKATSEIFELIKRIQARRPQMDVLVSLLSEKKDDEKTSEGNRIDDEDSKIEAKSSNKRASSSQGKGKKKKKKNKPKKG